MRRVIQFICIFVAVFFAAVSAVSAADGVPLDYQGGLLWVEATTGQDSPPLSFLLDTGASVSVINQDTVRRLGLKMGGRVNVNAVDADVVGHWPVKLTARADDVELPKKYLALDLSKLSGACMRPIDGLIGADFFRGRIVQIDYKAHKLRLLHAVSDLDSGSPGASPSRALAEPVVLPLESRCCGIRVPISVNGFGSQWVRLDTGCASALQWVTSQAPPQNCSHQTAVALTSLEFPTIETVVKIGNTEFPSVPTGLHVRQLFAGESGLLGNALLSRFSVVTIDLKSSRLILQ